MMKKMWCKLLMKTVFIVNVLFSLEEIMQNILLMNFRTIYTTQIMSNEVLADQVFYKLIFCWINLHCLPIYSFWFLLNHFQWCMKGSILYWKRSDWVSKILEGFIAQLLLGLAKFKFFPAASPLLLNHLIKSPLKFLADPAFFEFLCWHLLISLYFCLLNLFVA